jgi:hypothetical protein
MIGLKKEDAGGGKNSKATARSWAVSLLSQLMPKMPDANEFRVRIIPKPGNQFDVEVTVVPDGG